MGCLDRVQWYRIKDRRIQETWILVGYGCRTLGYDVWTGFRDMISVEQGIDGLV